jgi:hypothetical protein
MSENPAFGQVIKQATIDKALLTGPGEDLVKKLLMQMAKVKGFIAIFGPYTEGKDEQRWADYQRYDWSIRQLPTINVFTSQTEEKESDNAFLNGSIQIQVYWPPKLRRGDLTNIPLAFKGAMENFFASQYVQTMLDELYYIQRPEKVAGLNTLGKQMTWTPNAEGVVESDQVPVTIIEVKYRIDLRAWYRALEFQDRTRDDPFEATLAQLAEIFGEYDGKKADNSTEVVVPDNIKVTNP